MTGVGAGSVARVYAAVCMGSDRLSRDLGMPLVHVGVAADPDAAIRSLNERRHGCARRWPGGFRALGVEKGWCDWTRTRLRIPIGGPSLTDAGVDPVDDGARVILSVGDTPAEFGCRLSGLLRHFRLQEVTIRASFLHARCETRRAALVVHPRYTPSQRKASYDFRDARIVEDIYVLDPERDAARLLWLVVAAQPAVGGERRP